MKRIERPGHPFDGDYFLKHTPGGHDHDQSTHGRGGGGGEATATAEHIMSEKFKEYAKGLQDKARVKDKVVTPTLEGVAKEVRGRMVGLEHRIKEKTGRIAEKMLENAQESNLTPEQAKETVYDALRYTMELDPDDYAAGAERTLAALRERGFDVYDKKDKNYWADGSSYKGLNYVMTDKDGFKFELQFHTKDSMAVKMKNHSIYEAFRAPGTSPERRRSLYEEMMQNWNAVQTPRGVERLGRIVVQSMSL
jgi:hypothetical protein